MRTVLIAWVWFCVVFIAFGSCNGSGVLGPKAAIKPLLPKESARISRAFAVFDAEQLPMDVSILRGAQKARIASAKLRAAANAAKDKKK